MTSNFIYLTKKCHAIFLCFSIVFVHTWFRSSENIFILNFVWRIFSDYLNLLVNFLSLELLTDSWFSWPALPPATQWWNCRPNLWKRWKCWCHLTVLNWNVSWIEPNFLYVGLLWKFNVPQLEFPFCSSEICSLTWISLNDKSFQICASEIFL